jgi:DNA-binding CsgD family transcriptional regulator/tetratricopeptide (TPR) repeat protein
MIGREEELGRLIGALVRADSGVPTAVLVGGEAGIGKTRLVDEFVAAIPGDARGQSTPGVRLLRGGCVPLTGGLLPYAPVAEILRTLGHTSGRAEVVELAGPDLSVLAGFFPDVTGERDPSAPQGVDQYRLFAAVRRLLERLAVTTRVVVVLEDLHWADPSTLALVAYLVHGMRTGVGRLLLVATFRTDELHRRHPLRALLTELDRAGVNRLELGRLGRDQTAAQMAGVLNTTVDQALAARVYARSDGNPFLVEELLAGAASRPGADAEALPEGTRDILLRRLRRLPPADQRLLLAIAVAGRQAGEDLLADVVGMAHDALLERLRAAVDEHILVVVEDGYAFRHTLVAEALLAEALPGERTALHRAYAEALARRWDGDGGDASHDGSPAHAAAAAEMAHHWCQAGEPVRGLQACVRAGLAAERVFAHSEARAHFDRAIALWHAAPQARSATDLDVVELCRRGAEAAYLEGDTDHAIGLVRRALGTVDAATDPSRAGMLYERLGRYLWANGDAESESIGAYQRAVELVPDAPTAERARALTGLASAFAYADRPDPSAWCAEALRVARAAGARGEEGRALQSLGYCQAMAGDIEDGVTHCRQALAIAAELGQSDEHYRAYVSLVATLRIAGRTAEAYTTAMEGIDLARRRGAERTYGNLLLGDAVELLILLGRWDEADELLPDEPDVQAHGTPVVATNLWLSAANLHTWRGRFDLSQRFLDACMATYASRGHGHVRSMLHANQSEVCLWQGRFEEASRWIRRELDLLGTIDFTSLLGRLVFQGLRAEAGLARHADLPRLATLVDEMARRPDPPPDAAALIVMCRAELARVRGEADPDLWVESAELLTKLDMPWPVAFSRWRQAEALLARRPTGAQRQAGAVALSDAYAIATRLGAEPLRKEITALARRTRLMSVITPTHRRSADGGTSRDLTDREREVLELLCAGATNRRIARQLFISEKTVSIHVSRILAKLDAANRGEAAAIAHRSGLVRA